MDTTIEHLANRWAAADKQVLRHVFPLLAEGRPIQIEQIAEKAGTSVEIAEKALAKGRASLDAAGRVVELSGLTLTPSLHRVEVDGVALFSCCALLAHMTPFLLGRDVKLESVDLLDRRLIRFELSPTAVAAVAPAHAAATFVETEPMAMETNIAAAFCSHVHHFADRESASAFAASDERRYVVGIDEIRNAAEELYRTVWHRVPNSA